MLDADFEVQRRDFLVSLRLSLDRGSRVSLLGSSGAGKTTVLEGLAGLLPLSSGHIDLHGVRISQAGHVGVPAGRRQVGLIRQTRGLFPHLTALENIRYAEGSSQERALSLALRLGLERQLGARPRGLSEGQRQRVALARALQPEWSLLCLDEPFSALDGPLAEELMEVTLQELSQRRAAAILVTHRLAEAQAFADTIGVIEQGRVVQLGPGAELLLKPVSKTVAQLMGYRGFVRQGEEVLALHPELLRPATGEGPAIEGLVRRCRPSGSRFDLEVEADVGWSGTFHYLAEAPAAAGARLALSPLNAPRYQASSARAHD